MRRVSILLCLFLWFGAKLFGQVIDNNQVVTIPVVFHVLYTNSDPKYKITEKQILSQLAALNKDFSATNSDFTKLTQFQNLWKPSYPLLNFYDVAAKPGSPGYGMGIQFALAKRDPNNAATSGIDYIMRPNDAPLAYLTWEGGWQIDPKFIWDKTRYLNVFIAPDITVDGVSNRGAADLDLVGIRYNTIGTLDRKPDGTLIDYSNPNNVLIATDVPVDFVLDGQYREGGILTHEVGHFLNLKHTFPADYVDDTPLILVKNEGCLGDGLTPYFQTVNGISTMAMSMNFMDYPDDPCIYMFTMGQRSRARYCLFNDKNLLIDPVKNAALTPITCAPTTILGKEYLYTPGKPTIKFLLSNNPNDVFLITNLEDQSPIYVSGNQFEKVVMYDLTYYPKIFKWCPESNGFSLPINDQFKIPYVPCPKPTNLSYSYNYKDKTITITWEGDSSNYLISVNNSPYSSIAGHQYTFSANYASGYDVKIKTACSHETTSWESIFATFPAYEACPQIYNLSKILTKENEIKFTWSSTNSTYYESDQLIIRRKDDNVVVSNMIIPAYTGIKLVSNLSYGTTYIYELKSNCVHESGQVLTGEFKTCEQDVTEPNNAYNNAVAYSSLITSAALISGVDTAFSICDCQPQDEDWFSFLTYGTGYANIEVKIKNESVVNGYASFWDMDIYKQSCATQINGRVSCSGPLQLVQSKTGNQINSVLYRPCYGQKFKYYVRIKKQSWLPPDASKSSLLNVKLFSDFSPICSLSKSREETFLQNDEKIVDITETTIYPNPNNTNYLQIKSPSGFYSIKVLNILGETVSAAIFHESTFNIVLDIQHLEKGVYIILLEDANTKKLILSKLIRD